MLLDFEQQTVTFENCHQSHHFLATGCDAMHVCPFADLRGANDFLSGDKPGKGIRAVLGLGRITGVHPGAEQLASLFISTATGRCRVFAHWDGYAEFRTAVLERCVDSPGARWSDDPRMIPVYAALMIAVVAGIIWILL